MWSPRQEFILRALVGHSPPMLPPVCVNLAIRVESNLSSRNWPVLQAHLGLDRTSISGYPAADLLLRVADAP